MAGDPGEDWSLSLAEVREKVSYFKPDLQAALEAERQSCKQQQALPRMTKQGTDQEGNYYESQGRFHNLACAPTQSAGTSEYER